MFVKSIIREGLNKTVFKRKRSEHIPDRHLVICNSNGKRIERYNPHVIRPPLYKNAVLMHFNTRTAEEYINKINRGFLGKEFILYDKRIKYHSLFFI